MAIEQCWATSTELERDDNGAVSSDIQISFYENQCPLYGWVRSSSVTEHEFMTENLEIELRQFAFHDNVLNNAGFFYHCEVRLEIYV